VRVAVQLWLAGRVAPQVVEVTRKGHWLVIRRMVTEPGPGLVKVRVCVLDWPEVTLPKLRTGALEPAAPLGMRLPAMSSESEPVP
jgi:hypothetical protein